MHEKYTNGLLSRAPIAGCGIVIWQLLALWVGNITRLSVSNVYPTIIIVVSISIAMLFVVRKYTRSWVQANVVHFILVVYLLFGYVLASSFGSEIIQIIALFLLLVFCWGIARKIPPHSVQIGRLSLMLNLIVLPVALFYIFIVSVYTYNNYENYDYIDTVAKEFDGSANKDSPDVWHLVFDRYANLDTLKNSYQFDNKKFLGNLRKRGFNVVEQATANYQRTSHSLASTLNGIYLEEFAYEMSKQKANAVPLYYGVTNNSAIRFFNRIDYVTYYLGSWWDASRTSDIAIENINYRALPELARVFLARSVPGGLAKIANAPYGNARIEQCFRVRHKFERLKELVSSRKQKYVFAHFLVPHPPYVMDDVGRCKSEAEAAAGSRRDNYIAQLNFTNSEILQLIDAILSGPRKATIVLSSDEGPWPEPYIGNENDLGQDTVNVKWTTLSPAQLREKMGILLATRMHDGSENGHPESPINIYPAVLNNGFSGRNGFLKPENYIFLSKREQYQFENVTEYLKTVD